MNPQAESGAPSPLGLLVPWTLLVFVEVLAQLAIKLAGERLGAFDFSLAAVSAALRNGWLWVAIGSYCAGFFVWMTILSRSNLSRAFPTSAIVFVAVMLASFVVLNETFSALQWLGAAIIVAGILQLGGDEPVNTPADPPAHRSE
ncbi:MAG: EamA family transporter [Proteobacteria bacterium]|nr:EamA family transporter [Pseudomonadota bacterium]MBS0462618.1 EamA family transporter [Pseudomonadota bacterium]MBS0464657.1 EamA family transporter [Pseudomonadota bacterium]